jgi:hypothetical protein
VCGDTDVVGGRCGTEGAGGWRPVGRYRVCVCACVW